MRFNKYFVLACFIIFFIIIFSLSIINSNIHYSSYLIPIIVIFLYIVAHLFRIIRLQLMMIGSENNADGISLIHGITALPSSLLPFKLGEFIRLSGFLLIAKSKVKIFLVWILERYYDITFLTILIFLLIIYGAKLPEPLVILLKVFFVINILLIIFFLSITNLLIYLKRYFIFKSRSSRGLKFLNLIHNITLIQKEINEVLKGRVVSYILLTLIVWLIDGLAVYCLFKFQNSLNFTYAEFVNRELLNTININSDLIIDYYAYLKIVSLGLLGLIVGFFFRTSFVLNKK